MKYEEKKVLAVSVSLICVTIFIFIYASFVLNLDKMKFMYLLFFFFYLLLVSLVFVAMLLPNMYNVWSCSKCLSHGPGGYASQCSFIIWLDYTLHAHLALFPPPPINPVQYNTWLCYLHWQKKVDLFMVWSCILLVLQQTPKMVLQIFFGNYFSVLEEMAELNLPLFVIFFSFLFVVFVLFISLHSLSPPQFCVCLCLMFLYWCIRMYLILYASMLAFIIQISSGKSHFSWIILCHWIECNYYILCSTTVLEHVYYEIIY